jgi:hypothetical protein
VSVLGLAIAGVRVDLHLGGLTPPGLERYQLFRATPGETARWGLTLRPGGPDPLAAPACHTAAGLDGRWQVPGAEAEGALDPTSGRGEAAARPGLDIIDVLLQAVVGHEALARGGFLVRGACVVVDGRAHLFPAPSGAGKSTLARAAGHPLCDELCVLLPAGGGFTAHATPWRISRGGAAPLGAVYGLGWGGEALTWMPGTALRQLAANLVVPIDEPAARTQALAAAARAAGTVRWGRLRFRPGTAVDALLRSAWR